jgi:hypothetical protein
VGSQVPCGDLGLPSGAPVMHTIHDPRKTVMNPHNRADNQSTSSITVPELIKSYSGHITTFKCHVGQVHT